VAAVALEIPTNVPAKTRKAIDRAEIFFDILTSTKFNRSHDLGGTNMTSLSLQMQFSGEKKYVSR
jgi:hypothetical protein